MSKLIRREFYYSLYTYIPIFILVVIMGIITLNYFNLYKASMSNYDTFKKSEELTVNNGLNVDEELKKKYKFSIDKNGEEVIDNVLNYDYQNLLSSVNDLNPKNTISYAYKMVTFIFFPLIFTMYGINIASYDYRYKTIKLKIVKNNWIQIFLSKLISIYLMTFILFLITLITSFIISSITFTTLKNNIPINEFIQNNSFDLLNNLKLVGFSLLICLIYGTFGLCLGIIFKTPLIPALLFIGYNFFVPIMVSWDIRNLITILGHRVFNFSNVNEFQLTRSIEIPIQLTIILLLIYLILSMIFSYIISKKRLRYLMN